MKGHTMCKTYLDFPDFYNHPFIKSIADNEKWTVSDNKKKPIDMYSFIYKKTIKGALYTDDKSLVSLKTLCQVLPNATNNAYYMDALIDNFVVLDIEKQCPPEIKEKLLKTPYIYGEYSLSGKGYHLIFPIPKCFTKYPIAQKKIVMKESHGYYEILLQHYVTFTRNMLPPSVGTENFEELFEQMASEQKETHRTNIDVDELRPDKIPFEDDILYVLNHQDYKKKLNDFSNDISKYEYGFIGFLHYKLKRLLSVPKYKKEHEYTPNEKAWLLYQIAKDKIPYRPKHDESRDGLPWLLYLSREIIAKDSSNKK